MQVRERGLDRQIHQRREVATGGRLIRHMTAAASSGSRHVHKKTLNTTTIPLNLDEFATFFYERRKYFFWIQACTSGEVIASPD
jgi:hypothetical protein